MDALNRVGRGTIRRTCDICGRLRDAKPGVFRVVRGRWVCSYHESFIAPEDLDQLPVKALTIKPIKDARPFAPVDTYERAEAEIFRFATSHTVGYDEFNIASSAIVAPTTTTQSNECAARQVIYCADLITENKRPLTWIRTAQTRARDSADFLLARQIGGPSSSAASSLSTYGATVDPAAFDINTGAGAGSYEAREQAVIGLAYLAAYRALGDAKYLTAATRTAWFLRTCQATDAWGVNITYGRPTSDAAGTQPIYIGGVTRYLRINGFPHLDRYFYPHVTAVAVELWTKLKAILGDVTIGSSTATETVISGSRAALLSVCIADGLNFIKNGTRDVSTGTTFTGLSTSTPYSGFNAYPSNKMTYTGTGAWFRSGSNVDGKEWAQAIASLHEVGETTLAASLFDWLMTFSSNPVYELPTEHNEKYKLARQGGTYSPKESLATTLDVVARQNGSTLYSFETLGLLAKLYASRQASTFKAMKDAFVVPGLRSLDEMGRGNIPLQILGMSGLSFQPYTSSLGARVASVARACLTGNIYRHGVQAFMGRGH